MKNMKSPIIIANWKNNPATLIETKNILKNIGKEFEILNKKERKTKNINFFLALPSPFIFPINEFLNDKKNKDLKNIVLGAQNFDTIESWNINNTISLSQIKSIGAKFVILNDNDKNLSNIIRTERIESKNKDNKIDNVLLQRLNSVNSKNKRQLLDEDKNIENNSNQSLISIDIENLEEKIKASLEENVITLLYIKENEYDELENIINIIKKIIKNIHYNLFDRLIICYRPKNETLKLEQVDLEDCQEKVIAIRRTVTNMFGIDSAKKIKIIYNGKIEEDNVLEILKGGGVDGIMMNEESISIKTFVKTLYKIK